MSQEFEFSLAESLHSRLKPRADKQREEEIEKLAALLSSKSRYWMINRGRLIYDSRTQLLWDGRPDLEIFPHDQSDPEAFKSNLPRLNIAGFEAFRLPTKEELVEVVKSDFPLCESGNYRIKDCDYWLVQGGVINLDNSDLEIESDAFWGSSAGRVIGVAESKNLGSANAIASMIRTIQSTVAIQKKSRR